MVDMRDLVKKGYEEGDYAKVYARKDISLDSFEKAMIDQLLNKLKNNSKILDLGCGVGLPYDGYLVSKGFNVTGIDLASNHIEMAKKNVKEAKFLQGDFFDVKGKFDAIVSFYAIFHIPRTEHKKLFEKIHSLLKKDGLILLTLGLEDMKHYKNADFVGAPMSWSSYDTIKNKGLLEKTGFKLLITAEDTREDSENHLWVLAKKV